jgi:hypothetical protein
MGVHQHLRSRVAFGPAAALVLGLGCAEPRTADEPDIQPTSATATATDSPGQSGTSTSGTTATVDDTGRLDLEPIADIASGDGCDAVDVLFVIDNSASMGTYQEALANAFPLFIEQIFETLPAGISIHVGVTTTDFWCTSDACDCSESTLSCQTAASLEEVEAHYAPPIDGNNGTNGGQGRLFVFDDLPFFEASTDDDPAALTAWFSGAATGAGELGCSFEMPVAAAGYVTHPSNEPTNAGFVRDEGAVLLVFFLTDEPDKSPEPTVAYQSTLLDAKAACGGADCIITGGLIPTCVPEINQKTWQFLGGFGDEPIWSDIDDVNAYPSVVGDALSVAVTDLCETIIPAG